MTHDIEKIDNYSVYKRLGNKWYYCLPGNPAECSRPTKTLSNLLNIDMYNNFVLQC